MKFRSEEFPSLYTEDYKTLHHDIGLVHRSNGAWDLWFGQDEISKDYKNSPYLNIIDGDLVSATEIHSLQVGIIIACLTSWNYLNRTGNPLYTEFGNESYSLLKSNKGVNTQYKIKQFFIDCLNRMRRVYSVESLDVFDVEDNPYIYKVKFKVISITNTIVDGEFYLDTDSNKNSCSLDINYNHPYTSVSNPLFVECVLKNEYGSFIENELIYIYIKNEYDSKFRFYGVTEPTDNNGCAYITIPPEGLSLHTQIMFRFKGNSLYNSCTSKIINIESVAYYIKSKYVNNKHILRVEDSVGNAFDKFRLGELLSDYIYIDGLNIPSEISMETINENLINPSYSLEYNENDDDENYKLYLLPINKFIKGTNKPYYIGYSWDTDEEKLILVYSETINTGNIQLNSNNRFEVHFLIDDGDNGLFEIDFDDGHLYYKIDIKEYEI